MRGLNLQYGIMMPKFLEIFSHSGKNDICINYSELEEVQKATCSL